MERMPAPYVASEKEMLSAFLDFERATILVKIQGLSDEDIKRSIVPSGWSLLGMLKHLAWVEAFWFQACVAGLPIDNPAVEGDWDADWRIEPHETRDEIVHLYLDHTARSREIVAAGSLDDMVKGPDRPGRSLRWVLLHMIEETSRHAGHADIVRELIDGTTGA